jgi:hypothetical protein
MTHISARASTAREARATKAIASRNSIVDATAEAAASHPDNPHHHHDDGSEKWLEGGCFSTSARPRGTTIQVRRVWRAARATHAPLARRSGYVRDLDRFCVLYRPDARIDAGDRSNAEPRQDAWRDNLGSSKRGGIGPATADRTAARSCTTLAGNRSRRELAARNAKRLRSAKCLRKQRVRRSRHRAGRCARLRRWSPACTRRPRSVVPAAPA